MKKFLFILFVFILFTATGWAGHDPEGNVKIETARKAAENWINLIVQKKGAWGESESAYVKDIQLFSHQGKSIGYFCKVEPVGYIILTLRKELSPVKVYSSVSDLDPKTDKGMAHLIKEKMAAKIKHIENHLGALDKISSKALKKMLKINHQTLWDKLTGDPLEAEFEISTDTVDATYQQGEFLLTSEWAQVWPYNALTPLGTDFYPYINSCPAQPNKYHTLVGCVATAGAQIMRYWNWPPYGEVLSGVSSDPYDWPNMLDKISGASPDESITAVAELSYEVGVHVDMNWGCDGSGADSSDMVYVFDEPFRYSGYIEETGFSMFTIPELWFQTIQNQINQNRPIYYSIPGDPGHAVVLDGFQVFDQFNPPLRQFHMNYGYGGYKTAWYTLDEYGFEHFGDGMIINIFPAQSLLGNIAGTYTRNALFPYFYFDRDTTGEDAVFESGLNLQFLKGASLTNTSTSEGIIRIEGTGLFTENITTLFSLSDTVVSNGIKIYNGVIEVYGNGGIKIY